MTLEWFRTKTRFETEAKVNSEMVYCIAPKKKSTQRSKEIVQIVQKKTKAKENRLLTSKSLFIICQEEQRGLVVRALDL